MLITKKSRELKNLFDKEELDLEQALIDNEDAIILYKDYEIIQNLLSKHRKSLDVIEYSPNSDKGFILIQKTNTAFDFKQFYDKFKNNVNKETTLLKLSKLYRQDGVNFTIPLYRRSTLDQMNETLVYIEDKFITFGAWVAERNRIYLELDKDKLAIIMVAICNKNNKCEEKFRKMVDRIKSGGLKNKTFEGLNTFIYYTKSITSQTRIADTEKVEFAYEFKTATIINPNFWDPIVYGFEIDEEEKLDINIVDYSEKSFAVIGDTKEYKEDFKNLHGRWNPNLKCGKGWIFSKKRLVEVQKLIK